MKNLLNPQSEWSHLLQEEFEKPYFQNLADFINLERKLNTVFPPEDLIFNAFNKTPFSQVRVLIMGQDPYHGPNQAHGLSFSVPHGITPPPSLKNIFKELANDLNLPIPAHGCLTSWAEQGVMLLNATLTVRQGNPMSHTGQGWEEFTDAVIYKLSQREDPVIFVLWGKFAQEKIKNILAKSASKHPVLAAPHPSPFSAHTGFLGCRHFSQINELLEKMGKPPIIWTI